MIYRKLTLSAALVAFAGTAFAADQGLYIGAGFGYNKPRDENFSGAGTAGGSDKVSYDRGWVGMLNLGHAYGNGFRSEVELSQRNNGSDKVNGQGGSGDTIARALMLNGIYDISLGSSFVPYVGLGLGYASVKADNLGTFNGTRTVNDSDRSLAFQGILGVGFEVSDNLRLGLDYRYFGTRELDLKNSAGGGVDADYRTHSVMASLRYLFTPARMAAAPAPMAAPAPPPPPPPPPPAAAAPPPPPPPPPPPAAQPAPPPAPRTFIVFFDFARAEVTIEAAATIRQAADAAKAGNTARIEVTGHTDRAGSDRLNQELSRRRADAVKAQLQSQGIAADRIATSAKGEGENLVPTADNVREPQNRRVEIILR